MYSSTNNDFIKSIKKLNEKKYRDNTNTFLVEGEHLVEEAYKSGVLDKVIVLDGEDYSYDNIVYVSYEVMKAISSLDTPNKIMGVCKKKENIEIVGKRFLLGFFKKHIDKCEKYVIITITVIFCLGQ